MFVPSLYKMEIGISKATKSEWEVEGKRREKYWGEERVKKRDQFKKFFVIYV